MDQSVFYILDYLGRLTKAPLAVKVGRKEKLYNLPKQVIISPQFFRGASCQRCATCCKRGIDLIYTTMDIQVIDDVLSGKLSPELPYNLDSVRRLRAGLQRFEIDILGKAKPIWIYPMPAAKRCDFLSQQDGVWICPIHAVKPVNCMLPHIYVGFSAINQVTRLTKRPFGSRWIKDCKSVFGQFDAKELETWDLQVLRQLQRNAADLGISTFLPEITDYLETWLGVYKTSEVRNIWLPRNAIHIFGEKLVEDAKVDSRKFF